MIHLFMMLLMRLPPIVGIHALGDDGSDNALGEDGSVNALGEDG